MCVVSFTCGNSHICSELLASRLPFRQTFCLIIACLLYFQRHVRLQTAEPFRGSVTSTRFNSLLQHLFSKVRSMSPLLWPVLPSSELIYLYTSQERSDVPRDMWGSCLSGENGCLLALDRCGTTSLYSFHKHLAPKIILQSNPRLRNMTFLI